MARNMADVQFENHGSVVLIQPLTKSGTAWVRANIPVESWQMLGSAVACEPRMAQNIIDGMQADGLSVYCC